jgi:RNA-binding protein
MPAIQLTPAERKEHRSAAHHLRPVMLVGSDGLSDAVVRECNRALDAHGLIKVRVFSDDRAARDAMLATLAETLNAAPIQHIGKLLVLWRPVPPKARPGRDDARPGPKIVKVLKFSRSGNHRPQVKKVRVLGNERITAAGLLKKAHRRKTSVKKTAAA